MTNLVISLSPTEVNRQLQEREIDPLSLPETVLKLVFLPIIAFFYHKIITLIILIITGKLPWYSNYKFT